MFENNYRLAILLQNIVLLIVGGISLANLYLDGGLWWLAAPGYLALVVLYRNWPDEHIHRYLAMELFLVGLLIGFDPLAAILGFTFSAHAMLLLPDRRGAAWVGAMLLTSTGIVGLRIGWQNGLTYGVEMGVGYVAFGYFSYARRLAECERSKSQELLMELQETHNQLQTYAGQIEELAVAEERNRLAREIHDTLGHRLTVAAVQLEGAQRLLAKDPERAATMIFTVREQVSEALVELRQSVATLRSPVEADLTLPLGLIRLVESYQEATGMELALHIPENLPELDHLQRLAIYRAAQEGLTNVQRHAQASHAWIKIRLENGKLMLTVSDNGQGLAPAVPLEGFGLRGLKERAAHLGGEVQLLPRPEGGARLVFTIPILREKPNA